MSEMLHQIDCFNVQLKFFKYFGIWAMKNDRFRYYSLYSKVFVFLFVILYDFFFTLNFVFIERQLDKIVEEMILYLNMVAVTSKTFTFLILNKEIDKIMFTLESDMFQPNTDEGRNIVKKAKKMNVFYWKMFASASVISSLSHALVPLLLNLILGFKLHLPVCRYAFIPNNLIEAYFYPLYFYQFIGIHINMWYNVNIDSFFMGLMNLTIAQLDVLDIKLRNVTEIDRVINTREAEKENIEEQFYLNLKSCIVHYSDIADFCALIESTFSITLFVQFSIAAYVICVCLFRLTLPLTPAYLVYLAMYVLVMVLQILIPCWFGHQLTDKSSQLVSAAYSCGWAGRPPRFTASLRVLARRASRPLALTAWKTFPLLLTTFTSVANSAYSFYTLLRNVQTGQ